MGLAVAPGICDGALNTFRYQAKRFRLSWRTDY